MSTLRVFLNCFSLFSDTGSLTELETHQEARLASQQISGNCLSLPPQCWDYRCKPTHAAFDMNSRDLTQVLMLDSQALN